MLSVMNYIIDPQEIPQMQWSSGYVMNNMVNLQDIPQVQGKSGDASWIVDKDKEMEFWMKNLDKL